MKKTVYFTITWSLAAALTDRAIALGRAATAGAGAGSGGGTAAGLGAGSGGSLLGAGAGAGLLPLVSPPLSSRRWTWSRPSA